MTHPHMPTAPAVSPSAPVGAVLRGIRQSLGQSLDHVAAVLYIRAAYLDALESGRYHELPGPAYALGFVRSYSDYLGLDAAEMLRRVKVEMDGQFAEPAELHFPSAESEGKVPSLWMLIGGLAVAVALFLLWMRHDAPQRTHEAVPALPDRLAALIHQPDPNPPSVSSAPAMPVSEPVGTAGSGTSSMVAVPVPAQVGDVVPILPAPAGSAAASAARPIVAESNTGLSDAAHVVLRAILENSWLKVRDAQNKVVLGTLLHKGQSIELPTGAGYRLSVGNAGALVMELDGRSVGTLGDVGKMRLDIPLSNASAANGAVTGGAVKAAPLPRPSGGALESPPVPSPTQE